MQAVSTTYGILCGALLVPGGRLRGLRAVGPVEVVQQALALVAEEPVRQELVGAVEHLRVPHGQRLVAAEQVAFGDGEGGVVVGAEDEVVAGAAELQRHGRVHPERSSGISPRTAEKPRTSASSGAARLISSRRRGRVAGPADLGEEGGQEDGEAPVRVEPEDVVDGVLP
jgi:hypothetical protein